MARQYPFSARLSPADQYAPMSHTTVTLCFPSDNPRKTAAALGNNFRRYCRLLPYMTGVISRSSYRGFTMLEWDDNDADSFNYEEKKVTIPLPSYPELVKRNMPLQDLDHDFRPTGIITREYVERPGDRWPAMLVAYTVLDGGIVCCMSLHHHLVGGSAHGLMVHRVALVGSGKLSNMDAEMDGLSPLRRFDQVTRALGLELTETEAVDASKPALLPPPPPPPVATTAVSAAKKVNLAIKNFVIRMSALDALRDVLAEALHEDLQGRRPPSVAVMAAVVWCVINQIRERRQTTLRKPGKAPTSTLIIPVPATQLFDQSNVVQSKNFVGNLLSAAAASEAVSTLAGETRDSALRGLPADFPEIVKSISLALLMSQNADMIKGRLQQIMALPDVRVLSTASTLSANDLLVSSWGTMSFVADFGPDVGDVEFIRPTTEPATMRTTSRAFYQYAIILPKQKHNGQVTFELFSCFEKGDMAEFAEHPLIVSLQREAARL